LIDGKVADLVQNHDCWPKIFLEGAFESAIFLSRLQIVDDFDGAGEQDRVPSDKPRNPGRWPSGFSGPDIAQEDDVGVLRHELQTEQVLNGQPIDFLGPGPIELFEGFDDGKAGALDSRRHPALALVVVFALDQSAQVFR